MAVGSQKMDEFAKRAAHWNLEQDYEQRPRKKRRQEKETARLPIKTAEGRLQPSLLQDVPAPGEESDSDISEVEDDDENLEEPVKPAIEPVTEKLGLQQIVEAKEELARIAGLINEDPEENAGLFKVLSQFAGSKHIRIKQLAFGAQCAIYKDVIPGYRIRPLSDEDSQVKVSKEVRRQRNFEQALVGGYQLYLQELARLSKARKSASSEDEKRLVDIAVSCACTLLLAVPHFNFREILLGIIVDTLSSPTLDFAFTKCRETLEELFRSDEDGKPSRDAVAMLSKMIKARNYQAHESVLNTFLHLRLLSEFSHKGSQSKVDSDRRQESVRGKKPKDKKEFRTKKQRKLLKEKNIVEKEMREADATVGHEEREQMQAETLKLVFVTYFRILKARPPGLMGAVLEGLAKYAHLINQDFFGDLLEVLRDLIRRQAEAEGEVKEDAGNKQIRTNQNAVRESLLCVLTAFSLLQGQDTRSAAQTLNLDLNFFATHLYATLHSLCLDPNIERAPKLLRLPDPDPDSPSNKINIQTTIVLLLRCLSSVLLPQTRIHAVPPLRIAAFTKQLMTASLQMPEKSCLATLGLLNRVSKTHGKKIASLWRTEEKRGDGVFDALTREFEGSNPFASTVWEGELLRHHFCPKVREAVKDVEANIAQV
ncbi:MAG: hypothetical protein M1816_004318 [Peltula sp. TS41687]|nr:MAG: hypothetical protein M1816_004318 [Peltula sp. TS41687]